MLEKVTCVYLDRVVIIIISTVIHNTKRSMNESTYRMSPYCTATPWSLCQFNNVVTTISILI